METKTTESEKFEGVNTPLDQTGKGVRNFRQSPDIENFYRFVQEHSLRREAKLIFDRIIALSSSNKKKKKSKVQ